MFRIVATEISLNQSNLLPKDGTILVIKENTYEFSKIILVHKCSTYELNSDG
jgi:hypothetical protein